MADLPKSRLDLLALTVLALLREQPRHPYELQRLIRERHKDFAVAPPRALYHAVARLERKGFVTVVETTREGNRPERTVYSIADEGIEELGSWICDLIAIPIWDSNAFGAALSFMSGISPEKVMQALEHRVVGLEAAIAGSEAAHRALIEDMGLARLYLVELEFARRLMRAELDWTRSLLADIHTKALTWDANLFIPLKPERGKSTSETKAQS